MKKLLSVLMLAAMTTAAIGATEASSFAKGRRHGTPTRPTGSLSAARKHKKSCKTASLAPTSFEARKVRKGGKRGKKVVNPSPVSVNG